MEMKRATFYHCDECGSMVIKVNDEGANPQCCGKGMDVLVPHGPDDPGAQKHVPQLKRNGKTTTITVGEVDHPMEEDHYIEWIYIVTVHGVQSICLAPGITPSANFELNGDIPLKIFAYCNKHGLWMNHFSKKWEEDGTLQKLLGKE